MSFTLAVTVLGWFGALAGLVAYVMVSRGLWSANSLAFQGTNVVAASILMAVAAAHSVWPSAASNIVVILIGGNALLTVVRNRRKVQTAPILVPVETSERSAPGDSSLQINDQSTMV